MDTVIRSYVWVSGTSASQGFHKKLQEFAPIQFHRVRLHAAGPQSPFRDPFQISGRQAVLSQPRNPKVFSQNLDPVQSFFRFSLGVPGKNPGQGQEPGKYRMAGVARSQPVQVRLQDQRQQGRTGHTMRHGPQSTKGCRQAMDGP